MDGKIKDVYKSARGIEIILECPWNSPHSGMIPPPYITFNQGSIREETFLYERREEYTPGYLKNEKMREQFCDICAGRGFDYLDRPCRKCSGDK